MLIRNWVRFCIFSVALFLSQPLLAAKMACPPFLEPGFTVHVGDVSLNPERYLVRHGERTAKLPPAQYALFESLLFSPEFVRKADILDAVESAGIDVSHDLPPNFELWQISALKRSLKTVFGEEFSRRIINLKGFGFSWLEPIREEEIQWDQIWKPRDRPYFFYGDKPLKLTLQVFGILNAFRAVHCRQMDFSAINSYMDRQGMNVLAEASQIQSYMGRVNREISRSIGQKIVVVESAGYGTYMWKMRREAVSFCR